MRFETSVDIEAPQQRVWEVLADLEAWPRRIATVDVAELLRGVVEGLLGTE